MFAQRIEVDAFKTALDKQSYVSSISSHVFQLQSSSHKWNVRKREKEGEEGEDQQEKQSEPVYCNPNQEIFGSPTTEPPTGTSPPEGEGEGEEEEEQEEEEEEEEEVVVEWSGGVDSLSSKNTYSSLGDGVSVSESGIEGAGLGLYASREFSKNEPITLYEGKLLTYREATEIKNGDPCSALHIRSLFPLHSSIDGRRDERGNQITDPMRQRDGRGGAAWANDAKGSIFEVNSVYDFWDFEENASDPFNRDPSLRLVFIRAIKEILPGEEIFVDYGVDFWKLAELCEDKEGGGGRKKSGKMEERREGKKRKTVDHDQKTRVEQLERRMLSDSDGNSSVVPLIVSMGRRSFLMDANSLQPMCSHTFDRGHIKKWLLCERRKNDLYCFRCEENRPAR